MKIHCKDGTVGTEFVRITGIMIQLPIKGVWREGGEGKVDRGSSDMYLRISVRRIKLIGLLVEDGGMLFDSC